MSFQRLSKRIEGESRPPKPGWKVVPQSRTGSREASVAKFVVCLWYKQLPDIIGMRPQRTTTSVRQKMTYGSYMTRYPSSWCPILYILLSYVLNVVGHTVTKWRFTVASGSHFYCNPILNWIVLAEPELFVLWLMYTVKQYQHMIISDKIW